MDIEKLEKLRDIANEAALAAGQIIKDAQGLCVDLEMKEGGENIASQVVTEIDLKAEKIILEILRPTLSKYNLGLLSEESPADNSRFEKEYFWCVDPLDGTLAFSRGEVGYSTSIALVSQKGEAVIGVVYNPKTDIIYSAIKGQGAFANNKPFKVNQQNEGLTLFYDRSYFENSEFKKHIEYIKTKVGNLKLNPQGGAVMNAILTVDQSPGLYYKFPKKAQGGGSLWDFAASSVIQSEAGGFNSDFYQNPLELNKKGTTFMNDKGIIFCSHKSFLKVIAELQEV